MLGRMATSRGASSGPSPRFRGRRTALQILITYALRMTTFEARFRDIGDLLDLEV